MFNHASNVQAVKSLENLSNLAKQPIPPKIVNNIVLFGEFMLKSFFSEKWTCHLLKNYGKSRQITANICVFLYERMLTNMFGSVTFFKSLLVEVYLRLHSLAYKNQIKPQTFFFLYLHLSL
jgi:hypothetical protein